MSYPRAEPASAEYAYVDPKTACYAFGRLPRTYHPLDAWRTMGREPPSYTRWIFHVTFGAMLGFGGICYQNYMNSRPVYAGIHRHIIYTALMAGIGHGIYVYVMKAAGRRDAIIQHYLETHYDDFPVVGQYSC